MIVRLVWRSLVRRPGRSALLLAGYALGVGVTVALLSIGTALLEQARDRKLAGGGDLAVLPAGIDLETLKTGGVSSLYFTIDQAPFLYRQVLAGRRLDDRIEAAAPWIDDELVYLGVGGRIHPISGGGRIPSLSRALGVEPEIVDGRWEDGGADRRWRAPGDSALYAGMDRFHLPSGAAAGDTSWAEWHYFNVRLPGRRNDPGTGGWLYLTYIVTGAVPDGRWGGRVAAARVPAGGTGGGSGPAVREYEARVPAERVSLSLERPDLEIGDASVVLDSAGVYRLTARVPRDPAAGGAGPDDGRAGRDSGTGDEGPALRIDLAVRAASRQYLPPLDVSRGGFTSGYTAPLLDARASGRICGPGGCREVSDVPAYHDHNWGLWRDVTWDWGQARAGPYSVLFGGVRRGGDPGRPGETAVRVAEAAAGARGPARFLFLTDTLGFLGLYALDSLAYRWKAPSRDAGEAPVRPLALGVRAGRSPDTVRLKAEIRHVRAIRTRPTRALFYQMEGSARLRARLHGRAVHAEGRGFFETWRREGREGTQAR